MSNTEPSTGTSVPVNPHAPVKAAVAANALAAPFNGTAATIGDPFATAQPLTTGNLEAAISSARSAFRGSQENAAGAVARAFGVYYYCLSAVATRDMTTAYEKLRATANASIQAHNDSIANEVTAVKQRSTERKTEIEKEIEQANDPDRIAELVAEVDGLAAARHNEIREIRRRRKVKIGERSDALPFTEEVKLTLDLIDPAQAGQVNRYANAVGWVYDELYGGGSLLAQRVPNVSEITRCIIEAGGVERVAQTQRENRRDADAAEDRRIIDVGVKAKIRAVLASSQPILSVNMAVTGDEGGVFALLARKRGNAAEMLHAFALPPNELDALVTRHMDPTKIGGDAAAEFIGELLTAAAEITEPVLVSRADSTLIATFIKMEPGAPLLYGRPKAEAADVMPRDLKVLLENKPLAALRARLGSAVQRKLVRILVAPSPGETDDEQPVASPFAWISENEALKAANRQSAAAMHRWISTSHVKVMPHEVIAFTPAITVELSAKHLVELSAGQLHAWESDKAANKSNQVLTLEFRTASLSLEASKGVDTVAVQLTGPAPERECDVTLHPKTLSRAFSMLRETGASKFSLAADPRGAVQVRWETKFGLYDMYLPLCREKRDFETRLIAPMR